MKTLYNLTYKFYPFACDLDSKSDFYQIWSKWVARIATRGTHGLNPIFIQNENLIQMKTFRSGTSASSGVTVATASWWGTDLWLRWGMAFPSTTSTPRAASGRSVRCACARTTGTSASASSSSTPGNTTPKEDSRFSMTRWVLLRIAIEIYSGNPLFPTLFCLMRNNIVKDPFCRIFVSRNF